MPELPEVQTTVNDLKTRVLKRTLVDVWSDWEKIIKKPKGFGEFKKQIKNKKILKVWRRAKNIIFDLSEEHSLLVHQKMTGHLLYGLWKRDGEKWIPAGKGPLNDPYNRFLHLIFFLDNGKMLALSDSRKFAKAELWRTKELLTASDFKNLGPEPLDKKFNLERFKNIFTNKKGKIKKLLMDPYLIAGIGNIYSSEALWHAKINPEKDVSKLTEKELERLYTAIRKVLELGVKLGGESFSDYRKPDGSKGGFDAERQVYKREGQPRKRCGGKIIRKKIAGRSAFYCSACQHP